MKKALLIVDVQNDFCPNGALAVENGNQIIPVINQLANQFEVIIQTQDWHPAGHSSFASSHAGKDPYETMEVNYGEQVLWPDHCIQGTKGAAFHRDLDTSNAQLIIRKGFRPEIDSYSAFYENDNTTVTGLKGYLNNRSIDTLYVCGLATDFCVKWSVIDGLNEGFKVFVIEDAVAGIDLDGSINQAWNEMEQAGAKRVYSSQISF